MIHNDHSLWLFEQYFKLHDRRVEVHLKNGLFLQGIIIGYFRGNEDRRYAYISSWHLVKESDAFSLGIDLFGNQLGTVFKHTDILDILFLENNSHIIFK
jgi:hypothetical protein